MREILFRGKQLDNGEWAKGYLYSSRIIGYISPCENYEEIVVDPSTVGQYTGLTDKNGVKIFEGDILKTTNPNCAIWFVDYKTTAFCANQGNANYSCVLDDFMERSQVEVIGNIHDDKTILENQEGGE